MIYGELRELKFYRGISETMDKVIDFIQSGKYKNGEPGKNFIEGIDGEEAYFNVDLGVTQTEEERFFEGHKRYIDIHLIAEGEENIGYSSRSNVVRTTPWDRVRDFEGYEGSVDHVFLMNDDTFIIFFPEEPHMTLLQVDNEPKNIKKVIFKIKY